MAEARVVSRTMVESFQQGTRSDVPEPIDNLIQTISGHDSYTGVHSLQVSTFATILARLIGLDADTVEVVRQAGLVHDVGKAGIPPEVLNKRGRLTDEEFSLVKLHPILGSSMVATAKDLELLVPIVLHHHERWDGRGYPTGLAGVDIPVESRVILVADAFDAMTSMRPYGHIATAEEAVAEICRCAGAQFDPLVAEAMQAAFTGNLLPAPVPALHTN